MAGRIRQSDVEEVKARTNIADIVGEHVSLKSAGVGSMKGLCPFHDERSPSFHVRPQLGYYHCFGCGESGDVYTFLQRMDHVTFTEAVERLAGRIGYELHYEEGGGPAEGAGNRARLLAANRAAEEYFLEQLGTPEAEVGRRFLGERGFDAEAARHFGVGFAPKSWESLTRHLRGKGFTTEELTASGLVSQGDRGVYDRFRGRLIWPIRDVTGQTVGFGARKLLEDDPGPKYLNTPETAVYHKAQVLYGLDLAKREISKTHRVVVVEGYTDVMACHLAGVTTAIATCGTAFGVEHIKVLRRVLGDDSGVGEVVFTFDGDAAGQKAAMRAFAEERRFAAQTFVAVAPDGLDPCDLRLARGDGAVRSLVETKTPMFEFVIRTTLARFDLETVEGRVAALRAAAPVVADIRDPALRPGYTRELARMLGMELDEVGRAVRAAGTRARDGEHGRDGERDRRRDRAHGDRRPEQAGRPGPGGAGPGAGSPARPGDVGPDGHVASGAGGASEVGAAAASDRPFSITMLPNDPATRLERDALQVMLQYPDLVGHDLLRHGVDCRFGNGTLAVVRDGIASVLAAASVGSTQGDGGRPSAVATQPVTVDRVVAEVPPPFASIVQQLAVLPVPQRDGTELTAYVRGVVGALVDRELLRQKQELLGRLQRTDRADTATYAMIQRALVDIERERRALRGD
ncbi:DNA primase [Agromyces luteolus]|uniref:DNA primase n=1 Tax=Agromyces luteolus TaxID=88373 RepID=A0A7C9HH39_9MICO|nr:DNA primase [Agromyces luteolus]MUN06781.1 DNA primase [Agromyces luteolus]GLK27703.1 DNA primase [Agromyces luteolus]